MIGKTIGSYRVIDQIGIGGMATVYKAYDPGTDRYVALKILPAHYSSEPTFRERFQTEARAIAKLEHLHILPVYSYGEEDGTAYLVMRYMETGTLSDLLDKGSLSFRDIIVILDQLASALDYAHEHGVLHRDVKSSNVLLDPKLNAYLTDFGISKMVQSSNDITGANLIGTPQYMSPEQCKGGKTLTPAADQYSLGVVLFEMLTGRLPYQGETPMAVMLMQMHEEVPSARKLRPDMTADMEKVLLTAMAKEPDARFTTCSVMASAFTSAVNSYPPLPRTILTPARPTIARLKLEDDEKVSPAITDQPKITIALLPESSDQINALAFVAALTMGGAVAACSSVLLGIPIFLQAATGALYVYLARQAGARSGPVLSAVAAGVAGLIGGIISSVVLGGVLLASGFLDQTPFRSAAAVVLACGPISAFFAALGGFVASRLLPPVSDKPGVKPAPKPAAPPAAKPPEKPPVKSADKPAVKPAVKSPERPTLKSLDKPTDRPASKPVIKSTESAAAKPSERPSSLPAEKTSTQPAGKPSERPSSLPAEKASTQPAGKPADNPADKPIIKLIKPPADKPGENPANKPTIPFKK